MEGRKRRQARNVGFICQAVPRHTARGLAPAPGGVDTQPNVSIPNARFSSIWPRGSLSTSAWETAETRSLAILTEYVVDYAKLSAYLSLNRY